MKDKASVARLNPDNRAASRARSTPAAKPRADGARSPAPENLNPYGFALLQFERAADKLGLNTGTREVLRNPKRQLLVSIPEGALGRRLIQFFRENLEKVSAKTKIFQ